MKKLIAMLMLLAMLPAAAFAEIYYIEDESHLPEGWT